MAKKKASRTKKSSRTKRKKKTTKETFQDEEMCLHQEREIFQWKKSSERFDPDKDERKSVIDIFSEKQLSDLNEKDDQERRIIQRRKLIPELDRLGYERIIGKNDQMQINYLERGIQVSRSVCRIHVYNEYGIPDGYGTGFLISPTLLMTNWHVLSNRQVAKLSMAEFNFEYDINFQPKASVFFKFAPEKFYYTNRDLDFTIVSVSPDSRDKNHTLEEFGFIRLVEGSGKALASECVTLIHHPRGRDKQVSLRNNEVLNRFDDFLHYQTDTEPGSSGSPVFSDHWEVVALHHSGVPRTDNGDVLKRDGKLYNHGIDDPAEIDWIANEGVRISSIFNHLKQVSWESEDAAILEELGSHAVTDLNETLLQCADNRIKFNVIDKTDTDQIIADPVTFVELQELMLDESLSEKDLAPYFTLVKEQPTGLDPTFAINRELVMIDDPAYTESAQFLNLANWYCKKSRHRRYKKRLKKNPKAIKIVSEGDSWFQYPFMLHDTIDHIMDNEDYAVLSYGEAGDLIKDIVRKYEYKKAISSEQPDIMLVSGSGNDLVENGKLKNYLFRPNQYDNTKDLLNMPALESFKQLIISTYDQLFRQVFSLNNKTKVICHGYSYPVPDNGSWLGKPMNERKINNKSQQIELMRNIMDYINEGLRIVTASYPNRAFYLDLREVVPANGWYDELHPNDRYYGEVAVKFMDKIEEILD